MAKFTATTRIPDYLPEEGRQFVFKELCRKVAEHLFGEIAPAEVGQESGRYIVRIEATSEKRIPPDLSPLLEIEQMIDGLQDEFVTITYEAIPYFGGA